MRKQIKAFKIPKSILPVKLPKAGASPKAENTDPKLPHFSVVGLTIHGKQVGSALEWNVAVGLDILKLEYKYQVEVLGGRIRGGSVADFYIFTVPLETYLFAQGDYWHTRPGKQEEDQFLFNRIQAAYHKEVKEIWEHEALTIEMTVMSLKKILKV